MLLRLFIIFKVKRIGEYWYFANLINAIKKYLMSLRSMAEKFYNFYNNFKILQSETFIILNVLEWLFIFILFVVSFGGGVSIIGKVNIYFLVITWL